MKINSYFRGTLIINGTIYFINLFKPKDYDRNYYNLKGIRIKTISSSPSYSVSDSLIKRSQTIISI